MCLKMPRLIKTKQKYTVNCRFIIPELTYGFFLVWGGGDLRGLITEIEKALRKADENTFCIYWFSINPQNAIIPGLIIEQFIR